MKITPGSGVSGIVDGRRVEVGRDGVVIDGRYAGRITFADPIKATTPEAIKWLQQEGVRIVMVTGDSSTTAQAIAAKLAIDEVVAEV